MSAGQATTHSTDILARLRAGPATLKPRDAVTVFRDAAINEASGWRAVLRDENVPLV